MKNPVINKEMPILIVDDSSIVREAVVDALSDLGFKNFLTADDGTTGMFEYLEAHQRGEPVELIISDILMPTMTGIEFLKSIRAQNSDVPVLMLTSVSDQSIVLDAISSGANNYQVKPFKSSDIMEKLMSIMLAKAKALTTRKQSYPKKGVV